jgi:hypothetical protein
MKRLHILSSGVATQNARAFILPLVLSRRALLDRGWLIRVFTSVTPRLADCDALFVDGKALDVACDGVRQKGVALLAEWAKHCPIGYFDLSDSAVIVRPELLSLATRYIKNQLLNDRSVLRRPLYGYRLYTDYYHSQFNVEDGALEEWSTPIDERGLEKLRVGWNAGLGNYDLLGPKAAVMAFQLTGRYIYGPSARYSLPARKRSILINCRMATVHQRQTVAFQRRELARVLADFVPVDRVSKRRYFRELRNSRIVMSPFGWGEINQKDFEATIAGAAIMKPDLSHLETWPDYFKAGETYVAHKWDLSDVQEKIDHLLGDDGYRFGIANAAQMRYKKYDPKRGGHHAFADRVASIANEIMSPALLSSIRVDGLS